MNGRIDEHLFEEALSEILLEERPIREIVMPAIRDFFKKYNILSFYRMFYFHILSIDQSKLGIFIIVGCVI